MSVSARPQTIQPRNGSWARSALTHTVKVCVTVNLNTHVLLNAFTSGQLPFLG